MEEKLPSYHPSAEPLELGEHKMALELRQSYPEDKEYSKEELMAIQQKMAALNPKTNKLGLVKQRLTQMIEKKDNNIKGKMRLNRLLRRGDGKAKSNKKR